MPVTPNDANQFTLEVSADGSSYSTVGGLKGTPGLSGYGVTPSEYTAIGDSFKVYQMASVTEPGSLGFECYYDDTDAGQALIKTKFDARAMFYFRTTFNNSTTYSGDCGCQTWDITSSGNEEMSSVSITLKLSGQITEA